jgi:hypothetical protein
MESLLQCVLQYPGYFRIFIRTFRNDRKFRNLLQNVTKKKETSGVFCVCVCSFNIEGSVLFRRIRNMCFKALNEFSVLLIGIRIRSDRHRWVGSGLAFRACRSRSGSVSISTNFKPKYTFFRKSQQPVQNIENYDTYDNGEKDKIM